MWCADALALDPSLDVSQYAHTAWKVREGFAKGEISSIAQTPDGYLWLGTEFGLLRFDGVRAVPWQPPAGEQLPSNFISGLLVAHDGTLWIGTLKGLVAYKDGKLTQHREVAEAYVGAFLEDREQTVWFEARQAAIGRLCAIRRENVECYGASVFGSFVYPLYEDHKGNLWVASQTGLWRWAPGPPQHYAFPHGVTGAEALIEDDAGALLLATNSGLRQVVGGKIEKERVRGITDHFTARALLRSRDRGLWIGTTQGLFHLHQGSVDRFSAADGLSGDFVNGIFEDREGSVWVATPDGLDRFRQYAVPTISRSQGLSSSGVGSVQATPDGSIWAGTSDALNRWASGHVTVYRAQSASLQTHRSGEAKPDTSGAATEVANSGLVGSPGSLGRDDEGRLWASTSDGVFYFERGRFIRVPGIPGGNIFSIAGDRHGGVWILAVENLFHWFPNAAVRQIPWSQFGQRTGRAMLVDPETGGLWLGFFEGGLVYLKDGNIVRSYGAADGLGGQINHLRFGPGGGVWASTEGGLSRIKDGNVATMTEKNGLPCEEVHWSTEDEGRAVWLYMPCGLVRVARSELDAWINDPKHILKTTVFDNSDGVRSVAVYGSSGPHVTKSPDGRIWFAPRDGVSVIDPHRLPFNKLPPPVHVEQVTVDGKTYDAANGLHLPAHVRDLSIDYTALSLVVPEKVHFKVKLEGQDNDWRDLINVRHVEYTNLPPRSYRFRVTACNNSGVWNETGASLEFSIAPAYYQTTRFRLLCAAAFVALLWVLYQLRLHQMRQQFAAGLEARVAERLRIARELHDTLLQSVQGAVFQLQAARKLLLRKTDNAMGVLDEAIHATEDAIQQGRAAIGDLRPEPAEQRSLSELLNATGRDLVQAYRLNGHPPSYQVVVEGTPQDLSPMLQDEVFRVSREVVRNAFMHAVASHIEVEIRYGQDQLRLRIRDDGKGIDPRILKAGEASGHFGIPGMRERAKRIGARLEFWSEGGAGTEVQFTVPASMAYQKRRDGHRFRLFRRG
jgi:signal transduction histidine kinase/ligand-binding sensor domain-containing protein